MDNSFSVPYIDEWNLGKWFFTAHSAWCPPKESGTMTVELLRPEITKCEWKDSEGETTDKNVLGELAVLSTETKDIEDGKTVTFKIYPEGADINIDKPLKTFDVAVEGDKAETGFNFAELQPKPVIDEAMYRYYQDQGYGIPREEFEYFLDDYDKEISGETKGAPKYFYIANVKRCKPAQSEVIEIIKNLKVVFLDALGNPLQDTNILIKEIDGTEAMETTNTEGYVIFTDLIPSGNHVRIEGRDTAHG
jgi:hypothetical protein